MDTDNFLKNLLNAILIFGCVFVSYNIGKQSTITKVINLIEDEQSVAKDTVVLEDIKLDVSNMR